MDKRYGDIIRSKMKVKDNAQGVPVTIRMIERATQYSYEHIRKVVKNMPVVSRDFNDALCAYLGLDSDKMWSIAEGEKFHRKFEHATVAYMPPADSFFKENWSKLTGSDIQRLRTIIEGMVAANESQGIVSQPAKRRHAHAR
jgi:hypothetical protein